MLVRKEVSNVLNYTNDNFDDVFENYKRVCKRINKHNGYLYVPLQQWNNVNNIGPHHN